MLIQFHILQNYAPANLNRDDTGSPKDAIFGGKQRGRISSQCLKRSFRRSSAFSEAFGGTNLLGTRTKKLPELIAKALVDAGANEEELQAIVARVPEIGRESAKKGEGDEENGEEKTAAETEKVTKQLIFIGQDELPRLAAGLLAAYRATGAKNWAKAKIQDITRDLGNTLPKSVDIAMFGRMTTSSAFENVQAAAQVAHALSTNALTQEFDYYTAVDDISGESGAGMIGDVEFNSSTYYKYLNVHWDQLVENLGGDRQVACQAVLALLEAAATAHPSGKQNSFAAFSLPDFILVEISQRNLPVSYANAFLKPARAYGEHSLMDDSIGKLAEYITKISSAYDLKPERAYLSMDGTDLAGGARIASLGALKGWMAERLPGEG